MPKVTSITPNKTRDGRYSISIDDQFTFALSANDLLASGLHQNQELSLEELETIRRFAGDSKAYDQALNFLALRLRSGHEVGVYLKIKKLYSDEIIAQTIERLQAAGLIDDHEFARAWVADRRTLRPRSKRQLEQELRQKGLDVEVIESVLNDQEQESELEAVTAVIKKKQAHYPDQQKLVSYLMRQGFSYDIVKRALGELPGA